VVAEILVAAFVALIVAGGVVVTRWLGADEHAARAADRYLGTAVVDSVDWRDGEATIALSVSLGRKKPYPVRVSQRLDQLQASRLHLGSTVNVLIDPRDRQRVELDLD
jgi:hypothetical protein